jgi:thioredoxin 1
MESPENSFFPFERNIDATVSRRAWRNDMNTLIRNVSGQDFEVLVLRNSRPVLLDFWADWCGPCKALAPTLEELASEYAGEVDIVKVDVVANEELARRFDARSIPLLVMMKNGEEVGRQVGGASKSRLAALIDRAL